MRPLLAVIPTWVGTPSLMSVATSVQQPNAPCSCFCVAPDSYVCMNSETKAPPPPAFASDHRPTTARHRPTTARTVPDHPLANSRANSP
jgi:hypothetical protein